MKIYCQIVEHNHCPSDCSLTNISKAKGSIDISNLDELIKAKDEDEFMFTMEKGEIHLVMKYQLENFSIKDE